MRKPQETLSWRTPWPHLTHPLVEALDAYERAVEALDALEAIRSIASRARGLGSRRDGNAPGPASPTGGEQTEGGMLRGGPVG